MEHIAICRQPFFDMILSGEKTIESRWSQNRIAPFNKIAKGDTIFLKETGCQVTAKAKVRQVEFYNLTPSIADEIKARYGQQIGTDKFDNWQNYRNKKYCTLVWLEKVEKIQPFDAPKSHGAGWIIKKI